MLLQQIFPLETIPLMRRLAGPTTKFPRVLRNFGKPPIDKSLRHTRAELRAAALRFGYGLDENIYEKFIRRKYDMPEILNMILYDAWESEMAMAEFSDLQPIEIPRPVLSFYIEDSYGIVQALQNDRLQLETFLKNVQDHAKHPWTLPFLEAKAANLVIQRHFGWLLERRLSVVTTYLLQR